MGLEVLGFWGLGLWVFGYLGFWGFGACGVFFVFFFCFLGLFLGFGV